MGFDNRLIFHVEVELGSIGFSATKIELAVNKLLQCHQHGFLRSKETVNLNKYQHLRCIGFDMSCNFIWTQMQWQLLWLLLIVLVIVCQVWQMFCY